MKTDEVTWTAPQEFQKRNELDGKKCRKIDTLPPKTNKGMNLPEKTKIYSLQEDAGKVSNLPGKKKVAKRSRSESDSEDE